MDLLSESIVIGLVEQAPQSRVGCGGDQVAASPAVVQPAVEIQVDGAPSEQAAHAIGRTIARSPLVKTAIYGADPNWGRIVGAIGNSGIPLKSDRVEIFINGVPISDDTLEQARQKLQEKEIRIRVVLDSGSASARVWTCDLTEGYIRINADYTT